MSRAWPTAVLLASVAAALGACGGSAGAPASAPKASESVARPALLTAPKRPGEIVVAGDLSPATHGPYTFHGRYLVRFAQYAPEDARMDFAGQTAFVAALDRQPQQDGNGSVRLFRAAARGGRRTVSLSGRYYVDVSFGDFPYVVRFTPAGRR